MPPSKVLVMDADCSAGIECVQSLGRAGASVHVASSLPEALIFRSKYCAEQHLHPSNPRQITAWLTKLDQQWDFDLIIPATERSLMAFADPACSSELHRKAVLAEHESLSFAMNKEHVWQLAASLAIPVPPSVLVLSGPIPTLPFEFPVAVKPIHSKQLSGDSLIDLRVAFAQNYEELSAVLNAAPKQQFQIQQLVQGCGIGVELLFAHGTPVWHFAHERIHELPLTGGGSSYRKSIEPPEDLLMHSITLLRKLNWHGVAMVEWKVDPGRGAFLMEINPRLWGSLALAIDAGVDFPRGLLSIARGEVPEAQPPYKIAYYTRDLTRDIDWQIANFRADHTNPYLLVRPRVRSLFELFRPFILRESWDFFDPADPRLTFNRLQSYVATKTANLMAGIRKRFTTQRFIRLTHPHIFKQISHGPVTSRRLLFVCYGNMCRSPLAELAARKYLPECISTSAGFHPRIDRQSPLHMRLAAQKIGIDMAAHRSRRINAEDIEAADLVIVMDWKNYDQLTSTFPEAEAKTTFLGLFAASPVIEIEDPYEFTDERVDRTVLLIEEAIKGLGGELQSRDGKLDNRHR